MILSSAIALVVTMALVPTIMGVPTTMGAPADTDQPELCIYKTIPPELNELAYSLAVQENPLNQGIISPFSMAVPKVTMWRPGRTLRVKILNGTPRVVAFIKHYASEWSKHGNIKLEFVTWGESEIRVRTDNSGLSWSFVGTECLLVPQKEPTMNIGHLGPSVPESLYRKIILHEFGHALGAIHEHQSPGAGIPWNKPRAYEYFERSQGWTKELVDINVFNVSNKNTTNFSRFDRHSIMLYSIPWQLTTNRSGYRTNTVLSSMDKFYMSILYPLDEEPCQFPNLPDPQKKR